MIGTTNKSDIEHNSKNIQLIGTTYFIIYFSKYFVNKYFHLFFLSSHIFMYNDVFRMIIHFNLK
jgi:hypothetical protein